MATRNNFLSLHQRVGELVQERLAQELLVSILAAVEIDNSRFG
jgi:hypothetical protein